MRNSIKIKCPAKINLTLEIVNRREDGFHNIDSIMQMIDLYDYLFIGYRRSEVTKINLTGNSADIPYNEKNLVYKAVELYLKRFQIDNVEIDIYIEKNIPVSAGLAGGSTDAAGALYGLNLLFKKTDKEELNELCAILGSDLNVCLNGGCVHATSRGEITRKLEDIKSSVSLIKPKGLGISASEAYRKYSFKENKPKFYNTEKMLKAIANGEDIQAYLYNDLEYAVYDDYKELQEIKHAYPKAIMSGSGSTYFILENINEIKLGKDYEIFNNHSFIAEGVSVAN